ncbi:MAG: redoxin domain-containing protein [Planctomycetia bacterium]|nr:redoxin domain-containing protein [Planctomycetia bacterium]
MFRSATHFRWLVTFSAMLLAHTHASSSLLSAELVAVAAQIELRDTNGQLQKFEVGDGKRWLVVVFLGVECPLSKLYAERLNELAAEFEPRGARFLAVDSNPQDSPADLRAFVRTHSLRIPLVKDSAQRVADRFGAVRNPEVIVVDSPGAVRYRGRIDDQYQVGVHRGAAMSGELRSALEELVAGRSVSVPETKSVGCLITRHEPDQARVEVTYADRIAPLLHAKCVRCHRPGEAAPMSLVDYDEVVGWAAMIDEVVAEDRMPPWHAERGVGHFANDASLTSEEKQLLRQWLAAGCPKGDLRRLAPLPPHGVEGWSIGRPDAVVAIPQPFTIPATGTIEYQYFDVDPGFAEDRWVAAAEVRPSNRAVVHHCNVFLRPPGSSDVVEQGSLGSYCLTAMAAGTPAMRLPDGMAKRIPAGWHLLFVVHYTAVGSEQFDRTSLGLKFLDPREVTREAATRLMVDEQLCLPPHTADHRVEHTALIERDMLLLAMFPHMHLRGKSFRYEATYPDGSMETLLNVPRWDFQWQHRYELAEPKRLPAGTTLRCIAHYDNSSANSANPDPGATVRTGPLSEDEMFNGYYDLALAEAEYPTARKNRLHFVTVGLVIALVTLRRNRKRSVADDA